MGLGKRSGGGRYTVEQATLTKNGVEKVLNEQAQAGKAFVFAIPAGSVVQLVFEDAEG